MKRLRASCDSCPYPTAFFSDLIRVFVAYAVYYVAVTDTSKIGDLEFRVRLIQGRA